MLQFVFDESELKIAIEELSNITQSMAGIILQAPNFTQSAHP
jgi:hypothetical protein